MVEMVEIIARGGNSLGHHRDDGEKVLRGILARMGDADLPGLFVSALAICDQIAARLHQEAGVSQALEQPGSALDDVTFRQGIQGIL